MKNVMKKAVVAVIVFNVCFAFVSLVSAKSGSATLGYNSNYQIESDGNLGSSFTTTIYASSLTYSPTIETQTERKMFNLIWHDSGKSTRGITSTGVTYYTTWSANGSYATRATWKNITNGTSITGTFSLY